MGITSVRTDFWPLTVHSVAIHTITDGCDHMFVKCDVIPSLPTTDKGNNPDHHVWVCLSKVTGRVHSAYCTCAAGAGESCNHVAALLYALVDISQKKTDGESCTSRQCKWIIPRARKLAPLTSDNLNLMSSGRKSILKRKIEEIQETITHQEPSSTECLPNSGMPHTTINVERFRNRLCTSESKKKCGFVLTTSNYSDQDVNDIQAESACLPQLPVLDKCFCDHVDLSSDHCQDVFQNYFESIKVSEMDAATIERVTRGQQNQEQWKEARKERITSSDFGKVCVRRSSTEPDRLVHHVLGYGKEFSSVHTKWGITHEAAARQLYTLRMTQTHHDMKVSQCGLIVNPMYPYLGASPDVLVCCENCEHCKSPQGLLEIKCPSALRDLTPQDAALHTDFFCTVDGHNNLKLKENHPYFFQVQGQMAITQRTWVDFVVWTLKGMSIQRIKFDEFKWEEMCQKLRSFYLTAIVPELFSRRVYRGFKLCPLA